MQIHYVALFVYLVAYAEVGAVRQEEEEDSQVSNKERRSLSMILILNNIDSKLTKSLAKRDVFLGQQNSTNTELQSEITEKRPKRAVFVIGAVIAVIGALGASAGAAYGSEKLYEKIERGRRDTNVGTSKSPYSYFAVMDQTDDDTQARNITSKLVDIQLLNDKFRCDDTFCQNCGDVTFSLQLCSPDYCKCSNNVAKIVKCPPTLVYDPINELCDYQNHLDICNGYHIWEMVSEFSQ